MWSITTYLGRVKRSSINKQELSVCAASPLTMFTFGHITLYPSENKYVNSSSTSFIMVFLKFLTANVALEVFMDGTDQDQTEQNEQPDLRFTLSATRYQYLTKICQKDM